MKNLFEEISNETPIIKFRGDYSWLSNFHDVIIPYKGRNYRSVECAFMSEKNESEEWKNFCSDMTNTSSEVKAAGRKIPLVKDWDTKRIDVMRDCLRIKFSKEPYKTRLLQTGNREIIEGNTWGDVFWGFDIRIQKGKNYLGRLIMDIRKELQNGT